MFRRIHPQLHTKHAARRTPHTHATQARLQRHVSCNPVTITFRRPKLRFPRTWQSESEQQTRLPQNRHMHRTRSNQFTRRTTQLTLTRLDLNSTLSYTVFTQQYLFPLAESYRITHRYLVLCLCPLDNKLLVQVSGTFPRRLNVHHIAELANHEMSDV